LALWPHLEDILAIIYVQWAWSCRSISMTSMTVCWTNAQGHEGPLKALFSNEKNGVQVKDLGACHAPFVQKNSRKSSWCMLSYYCRQWQNYCNACSNSLCASLGFLRSLNPVAENTNAVQQRTWWLLFLQVCISVLSFCSHHVFKF